MVLQSSTLCLVYIGSHIAYKFLWERKGNWKIIFPLIWMCSFSNPQNYNLFAPQTHKTHRRLHCTPHCTSRQCMKYLSSINVRVIHRCYTWPTWQTRRLVELREKAWGFMNAQNNSYLCNTEAHRSKVTTVLRYKCIYIALQVKPSQDMHNARYIWAAAMFW